MYAIIHIFIYSAGFYGTLESRPRWQKRCHASCDTPQESSLVSHNAVTTAYRSSHFLRLFLSALATWSPSALPLNLRAPQSESVMTDGADDDEGETGSTWFSFFLRLLDG